MAKSFDRGVASGRFGVKRAGLELWSKLSHAAGVITITTPLWLWSGKTGSWHFITIAGGEADELRAESLASRRGFGSVKVEATINGVAWRTSVFPQKSGGYVLPVKKEVRCRADIAAGDDVTVSVRSIV